jgi:hypothetical protein
VKNISLLVCTLGLCLTGCHTYDVNGDKPVRYASGVQVITYDSTPRPPAKSIQIFDQYNPPPAQYHPIASLSHEGYPNDAHLIYDALEWRARQLGANGIILNAEQNLDEHNGVVVGNANFTLGTSSPGHFIFHAVAIIYNPAP